jgi:hypothetical protein
VGLESFDLQRDPSIRVTRITRTCDIIPRKLTNSADGALFTRTFTITITGLVAGPVLIAWTFCMACQHP